MWKNLDLEKIKKCVENKAELDKVFPGFILELKNNIDQRLALKYPKRSSWFGPDVRPLMLLYQPTLVEPIPLDWMCFGYTGLPIRECHQGILFDLHAWPVKYHMGVHAYTPIWEPLDKALKDARKEIDDDFVYEYREAVNEHQLDDPQRELDFNNLDAELEKIASRYEMIYNKFHPIFTGK